MKNQSGATTAFIVLVFISALFIFFLIKFAPQLSLTNQTSQVTGLVINEGVVQETTESLSKPASEKFSEALVVVLIVVLVFAIVFISLIAWKRFREYE